MKFCAKVDIGLLYFHLMFSWFFTTKQWASSNSSILVHLGQGFSTNMTNTHQMAFGAMVVGAYTPKKVQKYLRKSVFGTPSLKGVLHP